MTGPVVGPVVGVITDHFNPLLEYPNFTILALRWLVKDWLAITPTKG